jgi:adenosylhomocysteine nucleosidase
VRILVTFALENEFAPWRSTRDFRSAKVGNADVHLAEFGTAQLTVALTGVGARRAAMTASKIMDREYGSFDCCISSGLAGGLRNNYRIGEVLAARRVLSEALRADGSSQLLESSGALVSFAADCGATVADRFYTANHIVSSADEKELLGRVSDAVDMESFEILRESQAVGVPAIAIRALSDTSAEDLPIDMSRVFSERGQVSIPRVMGQVALNPQSLPGLIRLGKNSGIAAQSLARFLDLYVGTLASQALRLETKSSGVAV